ncbi:unknown protein [Simkania negevensis Z]|uniref:Uncharacterized protein n=1 Tax=Simkania negevensis (strain ATCC VR-1471 / DSM 27360 / Z) TaxID=331113 RepID=F8L4C6_SIMNZ|nr:unknown protein [Simkania negevensis Z]
MYHRIYLFSGVKKLEDTSLMLLLFFDKQIRASYPYSTDSYKPCCCFFKRFLKAYKILISEIDSLHYVNK